MHGEAESAFRAFRARGRPRDLARVFDLVAQELLVVAGHLARGEEEARELVQETFLAAIERRERWDERRPLVPWLLGILVRLARSEKRRRAGALERERGDVDSLASVAPDPAAFAADAELAVALHGAIASLPEAYREVLSLRLVHGLEAVEIAHALGRPLETVKTQLKRGKERLREALPRSLAALVGVEWDGLASMKRAVLAAAQGPAAGAGLAAVTGGAIVAKKVVAVVVLLACAGTLWWMRAADGRGEGTDAPRAPDPVPALAVRAAEERAAPARASREETIAMPPPSQAPAAARLACRVRFESDDTPAAGVTVALWHTGLGQVPVRPVAVTGVDGVAAFEGVPPGAAFVETDRGVRVDLALVAGQNEVELGIPPGVLVEGVVLDEREQPVPGAELWLSEPYTYPSDEGGRWVARAGPDGRFTLRDVWPNRSLAARARGRVPGQGVCIDGAVGARVEVALHIGAEGARLHGIVRDEGGDPVPDAFVFTGYPVGEHRFTPSNGGPDNVSPPPQCTRTDDAGRFELEAVPDSFPLWVAAEGYSTASERVTPERVLPLEITLRAEARLTGTVYDAAGRAREGAEVSVVQRPEDVSPAMLTQIPRWSRKQTSAGSDGRFELRALCAGEAELRATVRGLGEARAEVELVAGETASWSAVVRAAEEIAGSVRDERGDPFPGLLVTARFCGPRGEREYLESAVTAADGTFRLTGATRAAYVLRVRDAQSDVGADLVLCGVVPGTDALDLVFPEWKRASASFVARVRESDGRPFVPDWVRVEHDEPDGTRSLGGNGVRCDEGRLESGLLPPGRYRVSVRSAESGCASLGSFELLANERRDLGDFVVPRPGRLEVEVRDASGQPLAEGNLAALAESTGMGVSIALSAGRGSAERLQPGRYALLTDGYVLPLLQRWVEVRSGETAHVVLELPDALERWVGYPTMDGDGHVEFRIEWTCDGRPVCDKLGSVVGGVAQRPLPMRLPPGHHCVTLGLPGGRTATTSFEVNAGTTELEQAVVLRSPSSL